MSRHELASEAGAAGEQGRMVFIFASLSLQMERKGELGPVVPEELGDGLV